MEIREERAEDIECIQRITIAAFAATEHGGRIEADIVDALRSAGALALSHVAVADGGIVGHIAFSPVMINGGLLGWYGLGPVSVDPNMQNKGVGGLLIRSGLDRLEKGGAKGCVVLGDPSYYRRFSFENDLGLVLEGAPAEYFMRLTLEGDVPSGVVKYHAAFDAAI